MNWLSFRKKKLNAQLFLAIGREVTSGPFAGMVLPNDGTWSDADLITKALGCNECELHDAFETVIALKPDAMINIGASEGYYAIGI